MNKLLEQKQPQEFPEELDAAREGDMPSSPRSGYTVLVVDDEAALRSLYRRVFHRDGHTVLEAGDGVKALWLLERYNKPIDILVTDVVLPGLGGCELAERVRQLRPGIKVLFVSGKSKEWLTGLSQYEPGVDFLGKPCSPATLENKVRELLGSTS